MVRKLIIRFARRTERLGILLRTKPEKKAESVLEEVGTNQRIRCEGLERFAAYDPKSVEKFRGYCRVDWDYYFL